MKDKALNEILNSFKFIYNNLDGFNIKKKVDKIGIKPYINYCAGLAASTGAVSGFGGGATLVFSLPADIINTISQQFRVTLAIIYHRTSKYNISFKEFMKIVGLSIGVEAGFKGIEFLTMKVAKELLKRLGSRAAGRVIPILGGLVGGGLNFGFIKSVGTSLLSLEEMIFD